MLCVIAVIFLCVHMISADLLVAENGLKPWPSGHGEDPPPLGSLVRLDADGNRHVVKTGLIDPVWVVGSRDGQSAYVGLFHSGEVVRIFLRNGTTTTVAQGLSCPEGVALGYDQDVNSKGSGFGQSGRVNGIKIKMCIIYS